MADPQQSGPSKVDAVRPASPKRGVKLASNGLQPLEQVRTNHVRRTPDANVASIWSLYLGGITGGFSKSQIPEMLLDPDVLLGMEYVFTPILNAKVTVLGGLPDEQSRAQATFDRFWQHDLERFKGMFSHGESGAEVKYKEPDSEEEATQQPATGLEYDGMIPLDHDQCEPWVHDGRLAYIKAYDKIKLEGNTDKRPAKGFWLVNDPTYSEFKGNSILPGAWLFWRAKIGMPDSAVEVLLKANYKCAFSGLQVLYPSEDIPDDDGQIYDARAEAEWYAENIKAGTNVVLPSETDEKGNRKWHIDSYGGQPIDIQKMLPLMDWLTKQIHRGMGVVDDVITKEGNTGGYSRSNMARQMFLMLALRRARRIAHTFDQMVCRPLMKRNRFPGTYKIDVKIPGMEDELPNNGQGDRADSQGGQAGGEGEEAGPLAKLFQQAMAGEEKDGKGGNQPDQQEQSSPELLMSLNSFLTEWKSEIPQGKV